MLFAAVRFSSMNFPSDLTLLLSLSLSDIQISRSLSVCNSSTREAAELEGVGGGRLNFFLFCESRLVVSVWVRARILDVKKKMQCLIRKFLSP